VASPARPTEAAPPASRGAEVRRYYEDNVGGWIPFWDAMSREDAFLAGDRYEDDHGAEQRDRRLSQIRGQEIQDTVRHVVAATMLAQRSMLARAIDQDTDEDQAEIEVELVQNEMSNPWKDFEGCLYEAVQSAREMRLGVVWMDWESNLGPFGEILYRSIDPRRIMWDQGFRDPHHPMCRRLLERRRVPVDWVYKNFPGTESWIKPDKDRVDPRERKRDEIPLVRLGDNHTLEPMRAVNDNRVELWLLWDKDDPTVDKREAEADLELAEDERYMVCTNCKKYRSLMQGELQEQGKIEGGLPRMIEDSCPVCSALGESGTLKRIDTRANEEHIKSYYGGRRFTIFSPFNKGPDDGVVWDGDWPVPSARSFPGLFIQSYVKPGKTIGPSDVQLMWDQQLASDNLRTMALQRTYENRVYWEIPAVGFNDYMGRRHVMRDDQLNMIFRDMSKANFGGEIRIHAAPSFDAAGWSVAFNATQAALLQYRPKVDFGLTPESTKDIPVGTVEALERQGSVPIADFNKRLGQAISKFAGVLSDYVHATYTPQRISRLNMEGVEIAARMWGRDLPNYDFVIEINPPFSGLDKARAGAFDAMFEQVLKAQKLGLPVEEMLDLWASVNNVPRSIVRRFSMAIMRAKERAEELADEEALDAEAAEVPPESAEIGGFNGAGVVPEPEAIGR